MAKKRIIPKLQLLESNILKDELVLVLTEKYSKIKEIGHPVSQAKIYEAQSADELILNYLSPSKNLNNNKNLFIESLRALSEEIFIPIGVGGGIKSLDDIEFLLKNGADKIIINTIATESPNFIKESALTFGSSTLIVSIDYRVMNKNEIKIFSHSGLKMHEIDALDWVSKVVDLGAGEIMLTNIDRDGSMAGLDIVTNLKLSEKIPIPVISSGGCGLSKHFSDGFINGKSDAVAAGTFFCLQDQNIIQTKNYIKNSGIDIRTSN